MTRALWLAIPLLLAGCFVSSESEWKKTLDRDGDLWLKDYANASTSQVEAVLYHQLALTDDYEKRGWAKYGRRGWPVYKRAMAEGRLAVFYKATGKMDDYQLHIGHAIEHLRSITPSGKADTSERIERFINGLDDLNIAPRWKKELGLPVGPYRP